MQIIDKIEISYFRSIYSISLKDCNDLNVITGGNDAGKSNILKALNLFFNNETEHDEDFDFLADLSRYREQEARSTKGRMTIWIRLTFNNFLGWKSLPNKFTVKRTWNRYGDLPTDTVDETIPSTTLGRFLAKLSYHYIPAVRSRDIFSDLLADLHDTLLRDESLGLRQSSDQLVADLQNLTGEMAEGILERVKIQSSIDLPESLAELFRALNFVTKFGRHDIPLIFRGDGIQSRHLPFILGYISEKSDKYHIWGYEEPETSLEMAKSFDMAKDFSDIFAKDNQLFLTTHSPAFYDLSGDQVSKWYAESVEEDEIRSTAVTPITAVHEVDRTMGLLNVITPRMKEVYESNEALKASLDEMKEALEQADAPVIYVEGPTDAVILEHARAVLVGDNLNVRFLSANGAGDITQFLKISKRVKAGHRPLIGLYDADARGRKEYGTFSHNHIVGETNFRTIDTGKRIYVGMLRSPTHLQVATEEFANINQEVPLPIEFMFESALLQNAVEADVLILNSRRARIANEELPLSVTIDQVLADQVSEDVLYLSKEVDEGCKTAFAQWVVQQDVAYFEPFRPLMEEIQEVIAGN